MVTALYAEVGAAPPRFCWVDSPAAAADAVLDKVRPYRPMRLRAATAPARTAHWPVAARIAASLADLRDRLDQRIGRRVSRHSVYGRAARTLAPEDALEWGCGPKDVLGAMLHDSLETSLCDGLRAPLRTSLLSAEPGSAPGLTWYGQQDVHWIAHYQLCAGTGLASYPRDDWRRLGRWATLARSAGWWWPHDGLCVMAERPVEVHTEPSPHGVHGQVRPHCSSGPAVRFADGTRLYVLHGTPVPEWAVTEPTVRRIHAEPNVEVRRCAIEHLGWDTYVERAGLDLTATADDPGNPGAELRLYHLPWRVLGELGRVLLVVNGTVEPDGHRRRYGLHVPLHIDDPVAAAGWSYGLSREQYAGLARRT